MTIEILGFIIGIVGAIWMKASLTLMNQQQTHPDLTKSLGRELENPAAKAFIRGIIFVLIGLGLETYSRLFLIP